MRIAPGFIALLIALMPALAGCARTDDPRAHAGINADAENWASSGRTSGDQNYSPLSQINTGNVRNLALAWSYDLEPGNSVTAPVAFNGVLYTATGYSVVTALDAKTGRELWRYDPHTARAAGIKLSYAWGSRGLAYDNGRIFVGTQDGRLIALDARTGAVAWTMQTTEPGDNRYITGPPRTFNGKVVIGHGGADVPGGARGYVTCYDQATGAQVWRFYTVPGNPADGFENPAMEMAAATWAGEWWRQGGGGTVWNAMTYDSDLNTLIIGTGNGSPWDRKLRSEDTGDNLFLASLVALDADTGEYKWHYQVNPGESWDYNAAMDIQLADLRIDGEDRRVLLHAPKNGFFYVIDRTNGAFISAEPYVRVTWASRIDPQTGRPVENPDARYRNGQSFELWPGPPGAHNWLPMAFSPRTGLVYIPAAERPAIISDTAVDAAPLLPGAHMSRLVAWDPVAQQERWRVDTPGIAGGGVIATGGGLLFQGQIDHRFNAYDARSGDRLWSFDAGAPAVAPPITYEVDGVQYVTVLTGYGVSAGIYATLNPAYRVDYRTMPRRVLTFAIGGNATLPPAIEPEPLVAPHDPSFVADPARAARGRAMFNGVCLMCHGVDAVAGGAAPDLRISATLRDRALYDQIVMDGVLVEQGMPAFAGALPPAMVEDMRFYLRTRAQELPPATRDPAR